MALTLWVMNGESHLPTACCDVLAAVPVQWRWRLLPLLQLRLLLRHCLCKH